MANWVRVQKHADADDLVQEWATYTAEEIADEINTAYGSGTVTLEDCAEWLTHARAGEFG